MTKVKIDQAIESVVVFGLLANKAEDMDSFDLAMSIYSKLDEVAELLLDD